MAITKIHAITQSVQKAVDYICNPDKTDGMMLVDSFACCPQIAGIEFADAISQGTGRGNKQAFHLIQSFAPGEVDAEKAHEIGQELASRLLKGNHSYVIATHVDKHSIHNHIIFCAVDNFEHKKYYDTKNSYKELRAYSDELCREHGLSVLEHTSGKRGMSYEEWYEKKNKMSWKEELRSDIQKCISWANTYEDFIPLMRDLGYEVKGWELQENGSSTSSKYISFRAQGYKHFVRGSERSLGKGFSKEDIAAAIARKSGQRDIAPIPVKKVEDLVKKTAPFDHLIDTSQEKYQNSPGLMRWAENKNLKSVAHAFAEEGDTVQLKAKIDAAMEKASDIHFSMVEADKKRAALKELSLSVKNYHMYRKYDKGYRSAKNRERFYQSHEAQMLIFQASDRFIRSKGLNPEKVTYEQVMESIHKLEVRISELKEKQLQYSKDIKSFGDRLDMMQEYLDKSGIRSHSAPKRYHDRDDGR